MVEQSGELLLLVPAGCCPHPFESWYTLSPARCPVCAVLVRVPLSQTPSLHVLRRGFRGLLRPFFVRTLRWYYSFVRLRQQRACGAYGLWPSSTDPLPYSGHGYCWGLPVLAHEVSKHAWGLRLRRVRIGLALSPTALLPSAPEDSV